MAVQVDELIDKLPYEIAGARKHIASHVRKTYLQHSPSYSKLTGANVYLE